MNMRLPLRAGLVLAAALAICAVHANEPAAYKERKARISAKFKSDRNDCAVLARGTKEVCLQQAEARQKIAQAELEYGASGNPADQNRVLQARAEADYSVAREKCNALAGNDKDVCVKEARAIETKALIDARSNRQVDQIKLDAAQEKRNADYTVDVEKCEALAGDTKSNCISVAKARLGKN